jgi:hypothetical protein
MSQTKPVNTKALIEEAKTNKYKEAYNLLEKTQIYRIGVGARGNSPSPPSFFIEVIIKLSTESGNVNLQHLKKILTSLEAMQKEGYSLTYQDDNSISCEKTISADKILQEHDAAKTILNDIKGMHA